MAGAFVTLEARGLDHAVAMLNRLADPALVGEGRMVLGALIESQTKFRIAHEKRSPEGVEWPAWSPAYAASRHRGHALLQHEGHLLDSVAWTVEGDELRVGSNLVYAAIQQLGGTEGMRAGAAAIPARAYLGVSDANGHEIEQALADWIGGVLQ